MHLQRDQLIARASLPGDMVPRVIGILGFDGVATLDLIGPLETFKAARTYDNYHRMRCCYDVVILGQNTRTFVSESGIVFKADKTIQAVSSLDTIIIPGGSGCQLAHDKKMLSWLCE